LGSLLIDRMCIEKRTGRQFICIREARDKEKKLLNSWGQGKPVQRVLVYQKGQEVV
jgi:hypothetical protein